MPFKSEKQRRYMWANHPRLARKWTEEEKALRRREFIKRQKKRKKRD